VRKVSSSSERSGQVVAARFAGQVEGDELPGAAAWRSATAIRFCHDWRGGNGDEGRQTEVRLLWSPEFLFVKFVARYRNITVFEDAEPNGRRDHLWDRDVAEVFLQPNGSPQHCYKEIEVSPNGQWIDLDIAPGQKRDLQSGLRRRAKMEEKGPVWQAELALPMKRLTTAFDSASCWRVNFFRVEGPTEPRFYSAWRPTKTPVPNFHVPERFGKLFFAA
jgi:alpha-galactosidase